MSLPALICWTCDKCQRSGALLRYGEKKDVGLKAAVDDQHRERTQRCAGEPVIWPDISCDLVPMRMQYQASQRVLTAVRKALATGEA